MTVLYKPVRIESAEQAEALPVGTVAVIHSDDWHDVAVKLPGGAWREASADNWCVLGVEMVGWTALVPIEAEEETHSIQTRGQTAPEWRTRLVTPWDVLSDGP